MVRGPSFPTTEGSKSTLLSSSPNLEEKLSRVRKLEDSVLAAFILPKIPSFLLSPKNTAFYLAKKHQPSFCQKVSASCVFVSAIPLHIPCRGAPRPKEKLPYVFRIRDAMEQACKADLALGLAHHALGEVGPPPHPVPPALPAAKTPGTPTIWCPAFWIVVSAGFPRSLNILVRPNIRLRMSNPQTLRGFYLVSE